MNVSYLHPIFVLNKNVPAGLTNWDTAMRIRSSTGLPTLQLSFLQCVTDLDQQTEMIIFGLTLTTFESSSIFEGSWGSIEN
jgi:hypothetical protein